MLKMFIAMAGGLVLTLQPVQARLLANERTAFIQSFLANCHTRLYANPSNRDLMARGLITGADLDAFCQCGASRSADLLDTKVLEAFAQTRDRRPLLAIIDKATRACGEIRLSQAQ